MATPALGLLEFHTALVILLPAVSLPFAPDPRGPQQIRCLLGPVGVQDVRGGESEVQPIGDERGDSVGSPRKHVSVRLAEESFGAVRTRVPE